MFDNAPVMSYNARQSQVWNNRMAKDEAKSETLSVRVKPSVKRILERWAQEEDRSVSQIIERMVLAKDKKTSRRS